MMDIRRLEYFLAVAREESITRAAEALHMSQPPLSREMKALEAELGKQLLIRGSRKVTLTEEGMILRRRAEELVELLEATEDVDFQTALHMRNYLDTDLSERWRSPVLETVALNDLLADTVRNMLIHQYTVHDTVHLLHYLTAVHHQHILSHIRHHAQIMGNKDDGHAKFFL